MINSILETRTVDNGLTKISLQIPEKDFEAIYDRYSEDIALEILVNYLKNRGDDGKPKHVKMKHNKNSHIANITATLNYLGNEHSENR